MDYVKFLYSLDEIKVGPPTKGNYGKAEDMWEELKADGTRTVKDLKALINKMESCVELFDRVVLAGTPPPKNKDGVKRLETAFRDLRSQFKKSSTAFSIDGGIKDIEDSCHWLVGNEYY